RSETGKERLRFDSNPLPSNGYLSVASYKILSTDLGAHAGYLFHRFAVHLSSHGNCLLEHLELPHHSNQPHCRFSDIRVGALELALMHFHIGGRCRRTRWIHVLKVVLARLGESSGVAEVHDFQLAENLAILPHGAIGRDLERAAAGGLNRLAARGSHGITFLCDQLSTRRKLEAAIPGKQRSRRPVDRE